MLSNSWTAGPGEPEFRTLGDLYLCREDLTLTCMSRQRLEAGKKLLKMILGRRIQHQQDEFKDLEESLDELNMEGEPEPVVWESEEDMEEAELVEDEMIDRATQRWLDSPDKRGITPRQAAQTPEGRKDLLEAMKILEYLEDQSLKSGKKAPMRLDVIRKELGL